MKKFDYKTTNIWFVVIMVVILSTTFVISLIQFIRADEDLAGANGFLNIMDAWLHPVKGYEEHWPTPPLWNFFAMLFIFLNLIFIPVLICLMIFFLNSYKFENFLTFSYIGAAAYLLASLASSGAGLGADYIVAVCPMNKYIFYLNLSSFIAVSIFLTINVFVFDFRFRN